MKKYLLLLVMILGAYNGFAQIDYRYLTDAQRDSMTAPIIKNSDYIFEAHEVKGLGKSEKFGCGEFEITEIYKGSKKINLGKIIMVLPNLSSSHRCISLGLTDYIFFCKELNISTQTQLNIKPDSTYENQKVMHLTNQCFQPFTHYKSPLTPETDPFYWVKYGGGYSSCFANKNDALIYIAKHTNLVKSKKKEKSVPKSTNKLSSSVININPLPANDFVAGDNQILTITGNGFGTVKGNVLFKNADEGGLVVPGVSDGYLKGLDSIYIKKWQDDSIQVIVPSVVKKGFASTTVLFGSAGSGRIIVEDATGAQATSSNSLFIKAAYINLPIAGVTDTELSNYRKRLFLANSSTCGRDALIFTLHQNLAAHPGMIAAIDTACHRWSNALGIDVCLQLESAGVPIFTTTTTLPLQNCISLSALSGGTLMQTSVLNVHQESAGLPSGEPNVYRLKTNIEIKDTTNWDTSIFGNKPLGKQDFLEAISHEIGHALGIEHSMDTLIGMPTSDNQLMYYASNIGNITYADRQNLLQNSALAIEVADTIVGRSKLITWYADTSIIKLQDLENNFDLVLHDCPCDDGGEPNTIDCNATNATCSDDIGYNSIFFSNDIWNKASIVTDFTTMDKTHEPPTNYTLSSTQNTIAAELKNNSTCGSPAGDLKFYWAMGSTGEMWDVDWINHLEYCTFPPIVTGDSLGTVHIPTDDISINTSKKYGMQWSQIYQLQA